MTELLPSRDGGHLEELEKHRDKGLIDAADYRGWCQALRKGLMWGQELTLKALCKLLHVEVRLSC